MVTITNLGDAVVLSNVRAQSTLVTIDDALYANSSVLVNGTATFKNTVTVQAGQTLNTDRLDSTSASGIAVYDDLLPDTSLAHNIGSLTNKWNNLYTETLNVKDLNASGDAVIQGD